VIGDILQPTHLLFVLVIALLVLGPKRLPEVGRSLGRGLRDFKSALGGEERDDDPVLTHAAPAQPTATAQAPVSEPVMAHAAPSDPAPAEPTAVHEPADHLS
jgi:sec-independent protein translocase protein TatA